MKRSVVVLVLVAVVALFGFLVLRRNKPPEVVFGKVVRERIVSTLTTNGKVEPVEWASARAESAGTVQRVLVERGQRVAKGAALVQMEARQAEADLKSAESRMAQAQAELETLRAGGRASEISTIEGSLSSARQELASAQRELASLERLQARGAATGLEVIAARDRVERAEIQIRGLEARRGSLVAPPDRSAAEARLREAQAAAELARQSIALATVRAPIDGVVYQLGSGEANALKPGAYLNPGDLVANIGRLDRVRVAVYVDEPDLGRVEVGMPVAITWDAAPGRTWTGAVEKTAAQVVALGTRQVGEVQCVIDNSDGGLLPGTNVNAEIRSRVVDNALTVPKEAIRRENGRTGVFLLAGNQLAWRDVQVGTLSVTRAQVEGLKDGDSVALTSEVPLQPDLKVTPVYR